MTCPDSSGSLSGQMATPKIEIRVPATQRERWQAVADKLDLSLSDLIRDAVEAFIDRPAPKEHVNISKILGETSGRVTTAAKLPLGDASFKGPDPKPQAKAKGK